MSFVLIQLNSIRQKLLTWENRSNEMILRLTLNIFGQISSISSFSRKILFEMGTFWYVLPRKPLGNEVAKIVTYFSHNKIDKNERKMPSRSRIFSIDVDGNSADSLGQPKHENHMKMQSTVSLTSQVHQLFYKKICVRILCVLWLLFFSKYLPIVEEKWPHKTNLSTSIVW